MSTLSQFPLPTSIHSPTHPQTQANQSPLRQSPSILPPFSITNDTLLASQSFLSGLVTSRTLARAFLLLSDPSNTTLSARSLGQETFQLSPARFATALSLLMTDLPTFLSFTTNGSFSFSNFLFAADEAQPYLTLALSTHIASELLGQNGWFGVPLNIATTHADFAASCGDTVPLVFGTNTTICLTPAGEATYWSPITHRIYALRYQGRKQNQKLSPIDMLRSVQNGTVAALVSTSLGNSATVDATVVDMPTLFDGAYNCTAKGRGGGSVVNVDAGGGNGGGGTGTLDMSCLSRLLIYRRVRPRVRRVCSWVGNVRLDLRGRGVDGRESKETFLRRH